jgi:hypothetical protein
MIDRVRANVAGARDLMEWAETLSGHPQGLVGAW